MQDSLLNKYRPSSFDEVFGHDQAVRALRAALKADNVPSFLLVGPSGVGKTTIARLLAKELGCEDRSVHEVDAATYTGIDAMRALADSVAYPGLGETGNRVVIVDECHALSQSAWQSLLKVVEEPADGLYWVFCTTLDTKVPKTIKTRCLTVTLRPLPYKFLVELIEVVAEAEGWQLPEGTSGVIAGASEGSPRQALAYLSECQSVSTLEDVEALIEGLVASETVIGFCRDLVRAPATWGQVRTFMGAVAGQNYEGVRLTIIAYFNKVAIGAKSERDFDRARYIIQCFRSSYSSQGADELWESMGYLLQEGSE